MALDPVQRILVFIICVTILGLYIWWKWKKAGEYTQGMGQKQEEPKEEAKKSPQE